MNQNSEPEQNFMFEELLEGESFNSENQDSEIEVLNKLLKKLLSQNFDSKNVSLMKDVTKNISEILKVKSQLITEERKHSERLQKMRIEKLKNQGFTIEEFTQAVTMIFKITSKYIPEEKIPDFSREIDTVMLDMSNKSKNKSSSN